MAEKTKYQKGKKPEIVETSLPAPKKKDAKKPVEKEVSGGQSSGIN